MRAKLATIHFNEIVRILAERGENGGSPFGQGGYFVEIRFDDPEYVNPVVDEELKNQTIIGDCRYGTATIRFDATGLLESVTIDWGARGQSCDAGRCGVPLLDQAASSMYSCVRPPRIARLRTRRWRSGGCRAPGGPLGGVSSSVRCGRPSL